MDSPAPGNPPISASPLHTWFIGRDGLLRPFWRALLYLLVAFVILVLLQAGVGGGKKGALQSWRLTVFYVLLNAALIFLAGLFLRVADRRSYRALGLWFYPGWGRELLIGMAVGGGLLMVVVVGLVVTQALHYDAWMALRDVWLGVLKAAGLLALAATFEELAFRGYAFQRLVDSFGRVGAVLTLSALFGAVHLTNPAANPISTANTALAGIIMAVAYLRTRGLWLPIGLHWAWNFMMGPIGSLPVSGFNIGPGLAVAETTGPDWLSGGAYGPEGSVVLTVVCVAGIIWLARTESVACSPAMAEALQSSVEQLAEKGVE